MSKKSKNQPKPTSAAQSKSSKSKKRKKEKEKGPSIRTISENRKARHRFEIIDSLECGIVLVGSEVKSLRDGKISLDEAYVRVKGNTRKTIWLVNADIGQYKQASFWNHDNKRDRKLLVHKKELEKLAEQALTKGLTLIPLKIYFNTRGIVKLIVGVGRGKKTHDKREAMKEKDVKRQIDRQMKAGQR